MLDIVYLINGIIRIQLEDALQWLGNERILLPESIMSPPNYDSGFRQLLNSEKVNGKLRYPIYC